MNKNIADTEKGTALRWVKASERLPENVGYYNMRWTDTKEPFLSKYSLKFRFESITDSNADKVEWLEEYKSMQGSEYEKIIIDAWEDGFAAAQHGETSNARRYLKELKEEDIEAKLAKLCEGGNPEHKAQHEKRVREFLQGSEWISVERVAMNIVHQLYDLAEVDVKKRQSINDSAIDFVKKLLEEKFPPNSDNNVQPR